MTMNCMHCGGCSHVEYRDDERGMKQDTQQGHTKARGDHGAGSNANTKAGTVQLFKGSYLNAAAGARAAAQAMGALPSIPLAVVALQGTTIGQGHEGQAAQSLQRVWVCPPPTARVQIEPLVSCVGERQLPAAAADAAAVE